MRRSPGNSGLAISATASGRSSPGLSGAGCAASGGFSSLRMSVLFSPVQRRGFQILANASRRQHAAVAHQRHPLDPEPLPDARYLPGHRGRIAGVAGKHLHGYRATVAGAQQAEGDLLLALLAVPVVTELRQRAFLPLEVAGTDIVQNQRLSAKVPVRKALLDPALTIEQPVEHRKHLVAADPSQAENGAEAGSGRLGCQLACRRQLGRRVEHPRDDGSQSEIPLAACAAVQDQGQSQLTAQAQHGADMAMGQRPMDDESLARIRDNPASLEHQPDGLDQVGW